MRPCAPPGTRCWCSTTWSYMAKPMSCGMTPPSSSSKSTTRTPWYGWAPEPGTYAFVPALHLPRRPPPAVCTQHQGACREAGVGAGQQPHVSCPVTAGQPLPDAVGHRDLREELGQGVPTSCHRPAQLRPRTTRTPASKACYLQPAHVPGLLSPLPTPTAVSNGPTALRGSSGVGKQGLRRPLQSWGATAPAAGITREP